MPEDTMPLAEGCFVKTLNNMGYMTTCLDEFSREFVQFAAIAPGPVLDVGAAYGVATLSALNAGATVIANDIDERHLNMLMGRVDPELWDRVELLSGDFPELPINSSSLGAALVCRVLHFFEGERVERSAEALFGWLKPGGKVFIVTETPFVGTLRKFADEYARRKQHGDPWPGLITNMSFYSGKRAGTIPEFANWLDPDVLNRVFKQAGFEIERCHTFARPEFPEDLQWDGRESVGLVGVKPPS